MIKDESAPPLLCKTIKLVECALNIYCLQLCARIVNKLNQIVLKCTPRVLVFNLILNAPKQDMRLKFTLFYSLCIKRLA